MGGGYSAPQRQGPLQISSREARGWRPTGAEGAGKLNTHNRVSGSKGSSEA